MRGTGDVITVGRQTRGSCPLKGENAKCEVPSPSQLVLFIRTPSEGPVLAYGQIQGGKGPYRSDPEQEGRSRHLHRVEKTQGTPESVLPFTSKKPKSPDRGGEPRHFSEKQGSNRVWQGVKPHTMGGVSNRAPWGEVRRRRSQGSGERGISHDVTKGNRWTTFREKWGINTGGRRKRVTTRHSGERGRSATPLRRSL